MLLVSFVVLVHCCVVSKPCGVSALRVQSAVQSGHGGVRLKAEDRRGDRQAALKESLQQTRMVSHTKSHSPVRHPPKIAKELKRK